MSTYIIPRELLPQGFKYPKAYLDMITKGFFPDVQPWWFFGEVEGHLERALKMLKHDYPDRQLIPFALWEPGDDMSCFDGDDHSGDPKIHLIHLGTEPGWEERGLIGTFVEWLDFAKESAEEYRIATEEECS